MLLGDEIANPSCKLGLGKARLRVDQPEIGKNIAATLLDQYRAKGYSGLRQGFPEGEVRKSDPSPKGEGSTDLLAGTLNPDRAPSQTLDDFQRGGAERELEEDLAPVLQVLGPGRLIQFLWHHDRIAGHDDLAVEAVE